MLSRFNVNKGFRPAFKSVVVFVVLLWAIEVVNILFGGVLRPYGIHPREVEALYGVLTAPLLHGGLYHLISNSVPLLILGMILSTHGMKTLLKSTILVVLVGGILVWLFGRPSNHIGASGLVFGWWGFLIGLGYFKRDWKAIITAIVVLFLYGGMFFALFVLREGISYESHAFGAFAGIVAAALIGGNRKSAT